MDQTSDVESEVLLKSLDSFEMSDEDSVSESKEGIKLSLRNTPSNDENLFILMKSAKKMNHKM